MRRRWVVVRKNDGVLIASFASRYAAMLFSERRPDGPTLCLKRGYQSLKAIRRCKLGREKVPHSLTAFDCSSQRSLKGRLSSSPLFHTERGALLLSSRLNPGRRLGTAMPFPKDRFDPDTLELMQTAFNSALEEVDCALAGAAQPGA
jgi:hypothetical protein